MFKSVSSSKQRSLSGDDGGQPGSASWISARSESMLHIALEPRLKKRMLLFCDALPGFFYQHV